MTLTTAPTPPTVPASVAMLSLTDVHSYYGHIHALQGVDLEVRAGEIVTLLGTNGAGKTTTLKTISGLLHPRVGSVMLEGQDVSRVASHKLVQMGVAHAPEGRRIFSRLTVLENLQMGGYTRSSAEVREDTAHVFELFPQLEERASQRGGTLSGGEQQMLAIGRALMMRPKVLLLDEPSLGLSPILIQQIFTIIREINKAGHDDPARRAERSPGARDRRPRVRAPDRTSDPDGQRGEPGGEPRRSASLPRRDLSDADRRQASRATVPIRSASARSAATSRVGSNSPSG